MSHRTGITLRLTPADRTALEALQAFTHERTATRAIGIAVEHVTPTPAAHWRTRKRTGTRPGGRCRSFLDALDEVDSAQSSLNQVIQGLRQDAGSE